jgi:hypothetical protein
MVNVFDPNFQFSQHSLSDFADCPRRFYLRYIAKQAWPLVETGPTGLDVLDYQNYLRQGAILHRWIERYWLGISTSAPATQNSELAVWWSRFLAADFSGLPEQRLPELELVAPLGEHRLYARFDLLAIDPSSTERVGAGRGSRAVIVDWKTLRGENAPSYPFLKNRLQTRVYLYVLATAGAPFNDGAPFEPEHCAMRYWLANFPERPWLEIGYSRAEYEQDRVRLLALAQDAARREGEAQYEKTDDERHCTYCNYRTLCHRRGLPDAPAPDEDVQVVDLNEVQALEY